MYWCASRLLNPSAKCLPAQPWYMVGCRHMVPFPAIPPSLSVCLYLFAIPSTQLFILLFLFSLSSNTHLSIHSSICLSNFRV